MVGAALLLHRAPCWLMPVLPPTCISRCGGIALELRVKSVGPMLSQAAPTAVVVPATCCVQTLRLARGPLFLLSSFSRAFWVGIATDDFDAVASLRWWPRSQGPEPSTGVFPIIQPSSSASLALVLPCLAGFSAAVAVLGSSSSAFLQLLAVPRDPRSLPT